VSESSASSILADLDALDAFFSDETKWRKDVERIFEGRCLVLGAQDVCGPGWTDVAGALQETAGIKKQGVMLGVALGWWNDAPERTFADVKKLIADTRSRILLSAGEVK
jgi:hypothetical protein